MKKHFITLILLLSNISLYYPTETEFESDLDLCRTTGNQGEDPVEPGQEED